MQGEVQAVVHGDSRGVGSSPAALYGDRASSAVLLF